MPTLKQKKAVAKMVENGGNASRAMIEVGYSPATAHNPQKLTQSEGFLELCDTWGLTNKLIVESLVEDINAKPKARVKELGLAAKIRGLVSTTPQVINNTQINVSAFRTRIAEDPIDI